MEIRYKNRPWFALAGALALLLGLVATFALPQATEAQEPSIIELKIWVQDMHTKQDMEYLPGNSGTQTLQMEVGDKVRLRVQAIPQGEYRKPRYPRARWTPAGSQQEVRFSEFDEKVGTVVVEAVRYNPNVRTGVRYQLLDRMNLGRGVNANGNLLIEVVPPRGGGRPGSPSVRPPGDRPGVGSQGQRVVQALYQGILMRAAEPRALAERGRDINQGGYTAAVRQAGDIAASQESRVDIYSKGYTHEQRLTAMYEHLMGQQGRQIDPQFWSANLRRLSQGDINGVVTWMVRSNEFHRRFGFYDRS